MRIRFDHPAIARIDFQPGDELVVSAVTPSVEALLSGSRSDGEKVAHVVMTRAERLGSDETSTPDASHDETRKERGRGRGASPVS